MLQYRVESIKDLLKIIKFFDKYPLITKKQGDFILFKLAVNLALNKEHITNEGLNKIIAIKASINRGLSQKLKEAFPNVIPVNKPLILDLPVPNPGWLAGFTTAEGCFFIVIYQSASSKLGEAVQLKFILVQHIRDEQLMNNIKEYLNCGNILQKKDTVHLTITNFSALAEKIIPFFQKYSILGESWNEYRENIFLGHRVHKPIYLFICMINLMVVFHFWSPESLMDSERNHQYGLKQKKVNQVKILSKQISCPLGAELRLYSTLATCLTLNPYFVTGFSDGGGLIHSYYSKKGNYRIPLDCIIYTRRNIFNVLAFFFLHWSLFTLLSNSNQNLS